MAKFSIPISQLAAKARADIETVTRKITLELFNDVVLRSPVGNPELWAANASATYKRQTYNLFADALNTISLAEGGKSVKTKSPRTLAKQFPLAAGRGYVGGRFRANWNVSVGSPDETVTDSTDKGRGLEQAQRALSLPIGHVMYLTNALPYAKRLEDGYSTQAPVGMVKLAVMRVDEHVKAALE